MFSGFLATITTQLVTTFFFLCDNAITLLLLGECMSIFFALFLQVHVHKKKVLQKEQHRYLYLDDACKPFEVVMHRRLIENRSHLYDICQRYAGSYCTGRI